MGKVFSAIAILTLLACAGQKEEWQQPQRVAAEFRLAETEPADGLTETVFSFTGEKFYLHDEVVISNEDILLASVAMGTDWPIINVTLTREAAERFADVTASNVTGHMGILIDGRLVSVPKINAVVPDGVVQISFDCTEEEAERIADGIVR